MDPSFIESAKKLEDLTEKWTNEAKSSILDNHLIVRGIALTMAQNQVVIRMLTELLRRE